ncbi:MAG: fimbria/pilus periplasmic chaperone [Chlorobiaceae bacterium]
MKKNTLFIAFFMIVAVFCAVQAVVSVSELHASQAPDDLGGVMVSPTRIVFDGRKRSASLALINRSNKTVNYRLSFVQYRINEEGKFQTITEPGPDEHFASDYVRFTPRSVVLKQNQVQTVRLQLRKPSELAAGEYRSHLLFQVIPETVNALDTISVRQSLRVSIVPVFGLSIPVIVRIGKLTAVTRLTNLRLVARAKPAERNLLLNIEREGDRSVYGDLLVEWKAPGHEKVVVGRVNGISVHMPNVKRSLSLLLLHPKGTDLKGGMLSVRYIDSLGSGDFDSKLDRVFAQSDIAIP